jgi:hypothetical protein
MPSSYKPDNCPTRLDAAQHPRTHAIYCSHLWQHLPLRARSAFVYAALTGHDDKAPAANKRALLSWLDSDSAKRMLLLGAKTRAEAMLALLKAPAKATNQPTNPSCKHTTSSSKC